MKLLVRGGELACRNSWGGDLFQSRVDDDAAQAAAADLPGNNQDDEITSVTIPSNRPAEPEDRVVRDRPVAHRPPVDTNDAAHRDQEERARIIARGSRDAVAQARQRYSTRNQPAPEDDVVADDDAPLTDSGDRVIARQARFSDREFAAGMPPLRTGPVPREEVEQRGGGRQDRFDTVPTIDPDFDMPGQRHRPGQEASAPPEPEPDMGMVAGEDRLTAYEHVLQRARRIRASKQERMRPIRHADVLAERDQAAPPPPADLYDDELAYREPGVYGEYRRQGDELDDIEPSPAHQPFVDEEPFRDGENDDLVAETWDDDDDRWNEEDDYAFEPAPRRPGWLNRFGIGRRSSESLYDDATITRHAESQYSAFDDDSADDLDFGWHEPEPVPAPSLPRSQVDDMPVRRSEPRAQVYEDDLPVRRSEPQAQVYADELPAAAPVPPPVPASERAGGAWDVASMPIRPAPASSRQRQLRTAELPDLDDMLFDVPADRVSRSDRTRETPDQHEAVSAPPTREAADALQSSSPRDSFFRSSRFSREETTPPFNAEPGPGAPEPASIEGTTLPDLGGERLDLRDVVARGGELMDRRIEVAPDIPRQCRTCRSFRSADGGTRGWCTNEWAFTHRRMVNDDDLACVSAIGCWWLPADHLRLDLDDEIDTARTPRMDELIADGRPAARRVAGE